MPAYAEAVAITTNRALAEYQEIEADDEAALERMAANPAYQSVAIIPTLLTNGQGLVHNVTHQPADLIVMTSAGASGLEELLLGSNAEVIVRHAHCPVLIVKQSVAHFQPQHIVCAIDVDDRLNLIVLFTQGYKGLRHLLSGSVAEDVLNHATVPMLIMRV